jgi:hypothetical protein
LNPESCEISFLTSQPDLTIEHSNGSNGISDGPDAANARDVVFFSIEKYPLFFWR